MQLNSVNFQTPQNKPAFTGKHYQIETRAELEKLKYGDRVILGLRRATLDEGERIRLDRGRVERTGQGECKISQTIRRGQILAGECGSRIRLMFDQFGNKTGDEFILVTRKLKEALKHRL